MRGEHAVEADQVHARTGNERGEALQEPQRRHDDVGGAVLVSKALPLFKKSTSETGTVRLFKIADIAHDALGVLGELNPAFKIPAHWDNGVNFVLHTGGACIKGKAGRK
ncbi:MAG: hypothetical protein ABIP64_04945 [Burkholderiales bacterium]